MLKLCFEEADEDHSGQLEFWEFRKALLKSGMQFSVQQTMMMMSEIDVDNSGTITYEEFVCPRLLFALDYCLPSTNTTNHQASGRLHKRWRRSKQIAWWQQQQAESEG